MACDGNTAEWSGSAVPSSTSSSLLERVKGQRRRFVA